MGRNPTAPPKVRPPLQQLIAVTPHPSRGGNSYSVDARQQAMVIPNYVHVPGVTAAHSSVRRWRRRLNTTGSIRPFCHTGNVFATLLRGRDMWLVARYMKAYPKARADEVSAYVMNHSMIPRLISRAAMLRCQARLGMTTKVGSTSAFQAQLPINRFKNHLYFNSPPPTGIVGVNRFTILDIDEAGFTLESPNRRHGKAKVGMRVQEAGPYGHQEKVTVIAGIMPTGERYIQVSSLQGTSALTFNTFVESICIQRQQNPNAPSVLFTWDNLTSHHSALVSQTVHAYGHAAIARAPYHPWTGAIEYIFNRINQGLQSLLYLIRTQADLIHYIRVVFANLNGFDETFAHVGI